MKNQKLKEINANELTSINGGGGLGDFTNLLSLLDAGYKFGKGFDKGFKKGKPLTSMFD